MTPEQLKASVIQYALQGKLVEQRIEEGNATLLYQSLLEAKENLVKSKIIIKKGDTVPFYKDEYPFDIPETWEWVQLSDVSIIQEGAGIRKFQYRDSGTQILCVTNILDGSIDLEKKKLYIDTDEYKKKYIHLTLNKGDIVTSCSGGSWGKISFFNEDKTLMLNTSTLRMRFFNDLADNEYLYYVCQSSLFKNQLAEQLSGMQPNFGYAHYSRICFPLPPLEEQYRIVEQLKKTFPLILRYSEAYEKLEQFNAKFPEDMKKSILQYAIQGKLVEQRPEEGTAEELYQQIQEEKQKLIKEGKIKKEKPLAEISEDDIPFDIPDTWKWCRLSQIIDVRDGTHDSPKYVPEGIPLVTSKNLSDGCIDYGNIKYITQEDADRINERSAVDDGDILFAMIGSIGNPVLVKKDREFCIKNMALFKKYENTNINMNYMYWFFYYAQYALKAEASGGVQSFISLTRFREYLIPLPPYSEQERIAVKIEQMLPKCERLTQ